MDYEFSVCEEEAIWFHFPWCCNDFRHLFRWQLGKVVDELPGVGWVWYDEAEGEVVRSDHFSTEIMPFNHFHVLDGLLSDSKVKCKSYSFEVEEFRTQVILNNANIRVIIVADILVDALLWHLNKHDIRYTVPDLEAAKLKLWPVVSQFAEESICGKL